MNKTRFDVVKETAPLFEACVHGHGVLRDDTRTVIVVRSRPFEFRKQLPPADSVITGGYTEPPGQAAAFCDYLEEVKGIPFVRPALIWGTAEYKEQAKKDLNRMATYAGRPDRETVIARLVKDYQEQEVWRVTLFLPKEFPGEVAPQEVMVEIARHLQNDTWQAGVSVDRIVHSKICRPGDRVNIAGRKAGIGRGVLYRYYFVCTYRSRMGEAMYRLLRVCTTTGTTRLTCSSNIRLYVGE